MPTDPIDLIRSFADEHLDGNIDLLATFPLGKLRGDKVYGCPGRNFDADDTNLMRAIYCVVFKEVWPHLSMDNCGSGKLRGDTINTYNTLFGSPWNKPNRFEEIWQPDEVFKVKLRKFHQTCYTIGNMMVLPDRRIGEWSINKHRGCHDEWHDYADRFLFALRKVLLNEPDRDPDLQELVELNKETFRSFYGEQGWRNFITLNLLQPFVDNAYVPVVRSKGYTYWRGGYTNRDRFFEEANRYIDFTTKFVNWRAINIIRCLKKVLSSVLNQNEGNASWQHRVISLVSKSPQWFDCQEAKGVMHLGVRCA